MNGIDALNDFLKQKEAEENIPSVPFLEEDDNSKITYEYRKVNRTDLVPTPKNPYEVNTNTNEFNELRESIRQQGIINPLIVKELGNGKYEILSGERRWTAAKELNIHILDVMVAKNIDENEEDLIIAFSNNYRENKKISEKAKDIKLKYNALKKVRGGDRKSSEYLSQKSMYHNDTMKNNEEEKSMYHDDTLNREENTKDIIADKLGISSATVMRMLRIAELSPAWQNALDGKIIKQDFAIKLSYIDKRLQQALWEVSSILMPPQLRVRSNKCQLTLEDIEQVSKIEYEEISYQETKKLIEDIVINRINAINYEYDNREIINQTKKINKEKRKTAKTLNLVKDKFISLDKKDFSKEEVIEIINSWLEEL